MEPNMMTKGYILMITGFLEDGLFYGEVSLLLIFAFMTQFTVVDCS